MFIESLGKDAERVVNLSYNLRYTIRDKGTSVRKVAKKAGISEYRLRAFIHGTAIARDTEIRDIANALSCDPTELTKPYDPSMPD